MTEKTGPYRNHHRIECQCEGCCGPASSTTKQKLPESELDRVFTRLAVGACSDLRVWSDTDGRIGPARIMEFQDKLKALLGAVYFGTAEGLPAD